MVINSDCSSDQVPNSEPSWHGAHDSGCDGSCPSQSRRHPAKPSNILETPQHQRQPICRRCTRAEVFPDPAASVLRASTAVNLITRSASKLHGLCHQARRKDPKRPRPFAGKNSNPQCGAGIPLNPPNHLRRNGHGCHLPCIHNAHRAAWQNDTAPRASASAAGSRLAVQIKRCPAKCAASEPVILGPHASQAGHAGHLGKTRRAQGRPGFKPFRRQSCAALRGQPLR